MELLFAQRKHNVYCVRHLRGLLNPCDNLIDFLIHLTPQFEEKILFLCDYYHELLPYMNIKVNHLTLNLMGF